MRLLTENAKGIMISFVISVRNGNSDGDPRIINNGELHLTASSRILQSDAFSALLDFSFVSAHESTQHLIRFSEHGRSSGSCATSALAAILFGSQIVDRAGCFPVCELAHNLSSTAA